MAPKGGESILPALAISYFLQSPSKPQTFDSTFHNSKMSQKRKHGETIESSSSDPRSFKKHRKFNPGSDHRQGKHKKRPHVSDDIDKSSNINALKSRIRDLKRLLAHVDNVGDHKMSAGKRIERERELEACEHELAEKVESNREAEHRKKMIGKYHQVRFFGMSKPRLAKACCDKLG